MSTAHRPTWAPAQARQTGSGSKQVSVKDVAGNTKLKFRQPGQGTTSEISRRDLKLELARAEEKARNKRKGITTTMDNEDDVAGLIAGAPVGATQQKEDEQAAKRRKLIEDAAALDRDDSDDEEEEDDGLELGTTGDAKVNGANGKGKEKAVETAKDNDDDEEEEEEEDSEDEEDDEDETAELLRELEKIKRERAEDKARQESERASSAAISAEEAAAMGNPLLNLQAALSGNKVFDSTPGGYSSSASNASASFQIKKRWDDDVIFKNQAVGSEAPKKEFINDGIRSTFHRRFMAKYIA